MVSETTPLLSEAQVVASKAGVLLLLVFVGSIYTFSGVGYLSVLFMVPHLEKHPGIGGLHKQGVTEAQSLFFVGAATSCLLLLPLSDRVGRKVPMYILVACMQLSTIAECGATATWTYSIGVFCVGATECAATILAYVLVQESVHSSYRNFVAVTMNVCLGITIILMSLSCKYLTPSWSWRTERLLWYSPFMVCLVIGPFVIKDSPHFLPGASKEKEGVENPGKATAQGTASEQSLQVKSEQGAVGRLLEPDLRGVLAATCLCWVACAMSWYGLSYAAGKLSSDVYFDTALMAGVDICGYLFYGVLIGRLCADVAFTTSYLLIINCFPPKCRSTASGVANFLGRIMTFMTPMAALIPPHVTFLVLTVVNSLAAWATLAFIREANDGQEHAEEKCGEA